MSLEYNTYLAHHGIKGQKWGVRRFQNEDGTLKTAGRLRSKNKPESKTWKSNEAGYLSDEELRRRNNRLQMENQYRQNVDNVHPVKKELKQAAKKIFFYSAVGVASALVSKNLRSGAEFISNYDLPLSKVPKASGIASKA